MTDGPDNGQWLTYDEIATARGTEKIGAIRWAQERAETAHRKDEELIASLEADMRAKDSELRPAAHPDRAGTAAGVRAGAGRPEGATGRARERAAGEGAPAPRLGSVAGAVRGGSKDGISTVRRSAEPLSSLTHRLSVISL
jgi:hypothetical protein